MTVKRYRRLRQTEGIRRLVAETRLDPRLDGAPDPDGTPDPDDTQKGR